MGNIIGGSYSVEVLPDLKDRGWSFYRHLDGRIVRLPSDKYSLNHYLKKGLVLVDDPALKEETIEQEVIEEPIKQEIPDKPKKRKYKKRRKI